MFGKFYLQNIFPLELCCCDCYLGICPLQVSGTEHDPHAAVSSGVEGKIAYLFLTTTTTTLKKQQGKCQVEGKSEKRSKESHY